jgi:hypothetical protein
MLRWVWVLAVPLAMLALSPLLRKPNADEVAVESRQFRFEQVVAEDPEPVPLVVQFENLTTRPLRCRIDRVARVSGEVVVDREVPQGEIVAEWESTPEEEYLLSVFDHSDSRWPYERLALVSMNPEEVSEAEGKVRVVAQRRAIHVFLGTRERIYPYVERPESQMALP